MSTPTKLKRQRIEEANKRILGEIGDEYGGRVGRHHSGKSPGYAIETVREIIEQTAAFMIGWYKLYEVELEDRAWTNWLSMYSKNYQRVSDEKLVDTAKDALPHFGINQKPSGDKKQDVSLALKKMKEKGDMGDLKANQETMEALKSHGTLIQNQTGLTPDEFLNIVGEADNISI